MRGIILTRGRDSYLYPLTQAVSKHILPVYDKPMVYYPLSTLMLAGIRDILVISSPEDLPVVRRLLGDGQQWGLTFCYAEQDQPRGLAGALLIASDFVADSPVCLIQGDNFFYGHGLPEIMSSAARLAVGALVFAYPVRDPSRHGVIELDSQGAAIDLEEKPSQPRSSYAVPGMYFYDGGVCRLATGLKPSARGELEITDLNRLYLERGQLQVKVLGRGTAWLDAGTHESLLQASNFVQAVQERQGLMICCPEEVAFRSGFIPAEQLRRLGETLRESLYGRYLLKILEEG